MEIDDTNNGCEPSDSTMDVVKGDTIVVTETGDTFDNDGWDEVIGYIVVVRRDSVEIVDKRDAVDSWEDVDSREIEKGNTIVETWEWKRFCKLTCHVTNQVTCKHAYAHGNDLMYTNLWTSNNIHMYIS